MTRRFLFYHSLFDDSLHDRDDDIEAALDAVVESLNDGHRVQGVPAALPPGDAPRLRKPTAGLWLRDKKPPRRCQWRPM